MLPSIIWVRKNIDKRVSGEGCHDQDKEQDVHPIRNVVRGKEEVCSVIQVANGCRKCADNIAEILNQCQREYFNIFSFLPQKDKSQHF